MNYHWLRAVCCKHIYLVCTWVKYKENEASDNTLTSPLRFLCITLTHVTEYTQYNLYILGIRICASKSEMWTYNIQGPAILVISVGNSFPILLIIYLSLNRCVCVGRNQYWKCGWTKKSSRYLIVNLTYSRFTYTTHTIYNIVPFRELYRRTHANINQ